MPFTISILYGSLREKRSGIRAALFLKKKLEERGNLVHLIDPMDTPLPILNKMYKEYPPGEAPPNMAQIASQLEESDGFVIVSGEYNHSIPPGLKNLLDTFQKEYYFKPSAISTYSIGRFGGARVGPHLRAITGELGMPSISSMFPIAKINQSLDEEGNALDQNYEKYVGRFLDEFEWYVDALKQARTKNTPY